MLSSENINCIKWYVHPNNNSNTLYYIDRKLDLPKEALQTADEKSFELQGYVFNAQKENFRPTRIVRVAAIQNKIVVPTSEPIPKQVWIRATFIWEVHCVHCILTSPVNLPKVNLVVVNYIKAIFNHHCIRNKNILA